MDLPLRVNDTRRAFIEFIHPFEMNVTKAHIVDIVSSSGEDWHT